MKKLIAILLLMTAAFSMAACQKANADAYAFPREHSLYGTAEEIKEDYIILKEYETALLYQVSRDADFPGECTSFTEGDRVIVYYDGSVKEVYPGIVDGVYAIVRVDPGK